jgi:transcriptional regulator with XRE-family HTH domain
VLEWRVPRTRQEIAAERAAVRVRQRLLEDLERLCSDAWISRTALAAAAGVPPSFVGRIFAGQARPSIETYARLTEALGADLNARIYPNTGPAIRDRHQARILEAILAIVAPRWHRLTEVAVRRPARGWIDLVLCDRREGMAVASEIESTLNRIEQLVRWATEKAESLPSATEWTTIGDGLAISRLLVVRWTRANRSAVDDARRQLRVAYPAHPDDALEALTGAVAWPGPALVWARETDGVYRLVPGR